MPFHPHSRFAALALLAQGLLVGIPSPANAQGQDLASRALAPSFQGDPGFRERAPEGTGLDFVNRLDELDAARNRTLLNGSGVALGDYDGDGWVDVYLCGLNAPNALYRNRGGWRFQEVTAEAGVACENVFCRGAVMADVTGDGALDLLVTTVGQGTWLLVNDGRGGFSNQTAEAGLSSTLGSSTLALADVDGNQTLDLYVSNYRSEDIRDRGRVNLTSRNGRLAIPTPYRDRLFLVGSQLHEYGEPDQLFLNNGKGRFRVVQWNEGRFLNEAGAPVGGAFPDWGLTASFRDVNGDRQPDLFVCNDYWSPDRFWINQGAGVFRAIARSAWRKMSASSMGVDFADLDHDGDLDFLTVDMLSRDPALRKRQKEAQGSLLTNPPGLWDRPQAMRNTLFFARKDGTYAEVAHYAGIEASDWSWSPLFLDVDLDGDEDLLISAGHAWDVQDLDAVREIAGRQHSWNHIKDPGQLREAFAREMMAHNRLYPKLDMPIIAYRNRGNGQFEEVTERWGTANKGVRHGMATADLDNDGDLDLVANQLNGPVSVYENRASGGRISLRLVGASGNIQAIGTSVTLIGSNGLQQVREFVSGGHYLSGSDPQLVFGLPQGVRPIRFEIRWREGGKEVLGDLELNHHYQLAQGHTRVEEDGDGREASPLFEDVTPRLGHRHIEPDENEFVRQALLPFQRGRGGPPIAFRDLDGDGNDDLAIGGAQGRPTELFLGNGGGAWERFETATTSMPTDCGGILGWSGPQGARQLLLAQSGYERSVRRIGYRYRIGSETLEAAPSFAPQMQSGGAMALGDLRGNGTLVLFVAGAVKPGHYPLGNPSYLFEWRNDNWRVDPKSSLVLNDLGIVNGAVWSDLDGDAYPELVLACEWGPIRIFQNQDGQLSEATEGFGLAGYRGWWRGVNTVDLNGDGAMDIVATNWGTNSAYSANDEHPIEFFHGELARPGVRDVIETEFDGRLNQPAPTRQLLPLARSLPFLAQTFSSHQQYSEASLETVIGSRRPLLRAVSATTLESMIFLNEGDRFRAVPLPPEAQWAPASGIACGDFNGDGHEDLVLAQNFFPTRPGVSRNDSGQGLVLLGDGKGQVKPLDANESGFAAWGDQRAIAVGDYDQDGRADLAISQNNGQTRLFHNVAPPKGLRVRLQGPSQNPSGIGAQIRLAQGPRVGPAREIHSGAGYLSQGSPIVILHGSRENASVWVQWPGGKVTNVALPENANELTVPFEP